MTARLPDLRDPRSVLCCYLLELPADDSPRKHAVLANSLENCHVLMRVCQELLDGWPQDLHQLPRGQRETDLLLPLRYGLRPHGSHEQRLELRELPLQHEGDVSICELDAG